ncbi:MAG: T9SS type A sorting domain-containing protein [Cyclobacteriaceae bacterium]|nr:T9SS type A sorting domain-containing protein [Cyclobacteriaceae bacterium]
MNKRFLLLLIFVTSISVLLAQPNARYIPPDDPNRDPNWDWTVCCVGHTVYYQTQTGIQTRNNVQLPFFTQGHALADAVSNDKKDMWKQDGWILAYRDFGTPTIAPPLPFFVLYNKYRGVLRVMIYNARESLSSAFLMRLSHRSSSSKPPIFTMTNNSYRTLGATATGDPNQIESVLGKVHQLDDWFWADFVVAGYTPYLQDDAVIHLDLSLIDESKLTLKSTKFTLDQILDKSSVSNSFEDLSGKVIRAVDQGNRFYSTVDNVRAKFKETSERDKGEPWLKAALGSIANSGAASIVPHIGGLLGFVNYFIGGSQQQPMSFKGALEMDGNVTITKPLISYDFALSTKIPELPEYYKPLQVITWGLVNVTLPYSYRDLVTYYEPTYNCSPCYDPGGYVDEYGNYIPPCQEYCEWVDNSVTESVTHVIDIYVNPNSGMTLESIKYAYIGTTNSFVWGPVSPNTPAIKKQPTPLVPLRTIQTTTRGEKYRLFEPTVGQGLTGAWGAFFALEYTFKVNSPTKNSSNTVVVYKVYPWAAYYYHPNVNVFDSFNYQSGNSSTARIDNSNADQQIINEQVEPVSIENTASSVYPNPFSTKTTIKYQVSEESGSFVTIKIYNILGEEIRLVNNNKFHKRGTYFIEWDGTSTSQPLGAGIYIVKMLIGDKLHSHKVSIDR